MQNPTNAQVEQLKAVIAGMTPVELLTQLRTSTIKYDKAVPFSAEASESHMHITLVERELLLRLGA